MVAAPAPFATRFSVFFARRFVRRASRFAARAAAYSSGYPPEMFSIVSIAKMNACRHPLNTSK